MNKKIIIPMFGIISCLLMSCQTNNVTSSSLESETSSEVNESNTSSVTSETAGPIELDIYCLNDFHGRVVEGYDSRGNYEPGIAKVSGYLNKVKSNNPDNTIILNAGDMFQDTYDSGKNRGELLAKALPLLQTDAMAIGNHEFDWGIDYLKANREFSNDCNYLGANIYHYDEVNKKVLDFADELAEPYKIIERSGLKIGLIGIIGYDQITSITSTVTEGYTFLEPTKVVMDISNKLKGELDCDVVILAAHADIDQLGSNFTNNVTKLSNVTKERYVDAVFTGHSHKYQRNMINGVPFIQSGAHGKSLSYINLKVEQGEAKTLVYNHVDVPKNTQPDQATTDLVNSYLTDDFYAIKDEVIGTIKDCYSLDRTRSGQMLAWMTYEQLKDNPKCPKIDIVLNNGARNSVDLENGKVTRGILYDSMPFTNKTLVASVLGKDILNEINYKSYGKYRNCYYSPELTKLMPNQRYTLACIDYMLCHKNASKNYDYFPSYDGEPLYVDTRAPIELMEDYFAINNTITWDQVNGLQGYKNIVRS